MVGYHITDVVRVKGDRERVEWEWFERLSGRRAGGERE